MKKKQRLTLEEHTQLGRRLWKTRNDLDSLFVQLANAYPLAGSEAAAARNVQKAVLAIDRARISLEEALCREHPDQAALTVYYPSTEDRAGTA
ncbi:hypothetical protein ACIOJ9_34900 [Streptomyces sp. NPDC088175]|uniref:hypothetical protein n=1 Tax=unclassified Streptomyces TaxID=2593676 RepID=UPI00380B2E7B